MSAYRPTLYATPLSANGRKVLALAHHLRLALDVQEVNVYRGEGQTPELRALNPAGKIPTLVDGDLVLWESNAILQYLSEAYSDCALWSHEPARRADVSRWLFWEAAHWQPALSPVLAGFVGRLLVPQLADMPEVAVDWADPRFRAVAGQLDAHLAGREWVAGDALSLADLSLAGMAMYLRAARFPAAELPNLDAWYARVERLDAWRATAAGPWRA
jgi:glutathione S-transferase